MDMEDGELPSSPEGVDEGDGVKCGAAGFRTEPSEFSEDIFEDANYVIIQRPKSSLPQASNSAKSVPSSTSAKFPAEPELKPLDFGEENAAFYSSFGKKAYFDKNGVKDLLQDSDDQGSSSDSDSDGDGGAFSKKRSRMVMPLDSSYPCFQGGPPAEKQQQGPPPPEEPRNDFFAAAAQQFQKQRKPNNVWSNVIQEEEICNLGHQARVGGGAREVQVERGSETYYFQRAFRAPRPRRDSDSSDISSGGLSDTAFNYLRGRDEEEEEEGEGEGIEEVEEDEETAKKAAEQKLPTSFTSSDRKTNKRKKSSQKHKRKLSCKLKKMKAPELAQYMATKLMEQKVQLLERAIQSVGKDTCIHIFLKTLKIEKRGGIMVKSQERRRTAGGVFLYLLRGDPRLDKKAVDFVFRDDRQFYDQMRKKKMATKRLHNKAELESVLKAGATEMDSGSPEEADDSSMDQADEDEMMGLAGVQFGGSNL